MRKPIRQPRIIVAIQTGQERPRLPAIVIDVDYPITSKKLRTIENLVLAEAKAGRFICYVCLLNFWFIKRDNIESLERLSTHINVCIIGKEPPQKRPSVGYYYPGDAKGVTTLDNPSRIFHLISQVF